MARHAFDSIPVHRAKGATPSGPAEQEAPIVIVGAGPVGLTAALDLGRRGHRVVVLNQLDFIAGGSKAICFSKRTLDIWNRLGVARRMVDKGVVWNRGKVFRGDRPEPIYEFDMLAVKDQEMPGFINLQQYHAEDFLVDALADLDTVEIRWGHRVTAFDAAATTLHVQAGEGDYQLKADWVLACDGSRSPLRTMMGLDFDGRVFEDNFLIADVRFAEDRPAERWFWFDPLWGGASALLHKQPDGIWRLDFQLGADIDREAAASPEAVTRLVRGMIGPDIAFELVWVSVYTFQCRRMAKFVHDHVIFLGDSAHLVSPFGARGCNGGIADVDNLCWKLDAVLKGEAPHSLIDSYEIEAGIAADENILNSTRATDFMVPRSAAARALRDAVLDLAPACAFARPFVNSGRLSTPVSYPSGPLTTPDRDRWTVGVPPGSPAIDAPLADGWLLPRLAGQWSLLALAPIPGAPLPVVVADSEAARALYGLKPGSAYLLRPDQYVAARWKSFTLSDLKGTAWEAQA
jgi:3-(3-hydroxy-phenyl)propionate hydroxylase